MAVKKKKKRPIQHHARVIGSRAKYLEGKVEKILLRMTEKVLNNVTREFRTAGTVFMVPPNTPAFTSRVRKGGGAAVTAATAATDALRALSEAISGAPPDAVRHAPVRALVVGVRKALSEEELAELADMLTTADERALFVLISRYGLLQVASAGNRLLGGAFIIPPTFEAEYLRKNVVMIQQLSKNIERDFREGVGKALSAWSSEDKPLTSREFTRRMRTHHFIPKDKWTEADQGLLKPLNDSTSIAGLGHRARTISRTEVARARNAGDHEAIKQAGFTHKQWNSYQDDFSRPGHADMNGQTVRVGDSFENPETGAQLMYPGDPGAEANETINCRCGVVPVLVDVGTDVAESATDEGEGS